MPAGSKGYSCLPATQAFTTYALGVAVPSNWIYQAYNS